MHLNFGPLCPPPLACYCNAWTPRYLRMLYGNMSHIKAPNMKFEVNNSRVFQCSTLMCDSPQCKNIKPICVEIIAEGPMPCVSLKNRSNLKWMRCGHKLNIRKEMQYTVLFWYLFSQHIDTHFLWYLQGRSILEPIPILISYWYPTDILPISYGDLYHEESLSIPIQIPKSGFQSYQYR